MFSQKDPQTAIEYATKAAHLSPSSFEAYQERCRAYRDARHLQAAVADVQMALSIAPYNERLRHLLAALEREAGDERSTGVPDIVPRKDAF